MIVGPPYEASRRAAAGLRPAAALPAGAHDGAVGDRVGAPRHACARAQKYVAERLDSLVVYCFFLAIHMSCVFSFIYLLGAGPEISLRPAPGAASEVPRVRRHSCLKNNNWLIHQQYVHVYLYSIYGICCIHIISNVM